VTRVSWSRQFAWVLAVAAMLFGILCLIFTSWCVDHDVLFPDGGRWTRGDGVTTRGEMVWQGIVYLGLGILVGPLWALNGWVERRRAGNSGASAPTRSAND
jgi:hypothetical protein